MYNLKLTVYIHTCTEHAYMYAYCIVENFCIGQNTKTFSSCGTTQPFENQIQQVLEWSLEHFIFVKIGSPKTSCYKSITKQRELYNYSDKSIATKAEVFSEHNSPLGIRTHTPSDMCIYLLGDWVGNAHTEKVGLELHRL